MRIDETKALNLNLLVVRRTHRAHPHGVASRSTPRAGHERVRVPGCQLFRRWTGYGEHPRAWPTPRVETVSVSELSDDVPQHLDAFFDLPDAQGGIAHDKPDAIGLSCSRLPMIKRRNGVQT